MSSGSMSSGSNRMAIATMAAVRDVMGRHGSF